MGLSFVSVTTTSSETYSTRARKMGCWGDDWEGSGAASSEATAPTTHMTRATLTKASRLRDCR
jgi:hypothetical protein